MSSLGSGDLGSNI